MARLAMRLFGPFQATLDGKELEGFKSDKARALLAYLVVEAGRPHSRESLAGLLWPEMSESAAQTSLRSVLANLRKILGDANNSLPFLIVSRETIQFNLVSDHWLDVNTFTELNADDRGKSARLDQLEQAAAIYRSPFLEGFSLRDSSPFEEWIIIRRERYNQQALSVLHHLGESYAKRGEYERALPYAWRQVELEPWQEEAHQQLMRLLALNGQRSAAMAQFETLRRMLADELDIEPGQETLRLIKEIDDGSLLREVKESSGLPSPGIPPYKGLDYFDENDTEFFFGREEITAKLVSRIQQTLLPDGKEKTQGLRFLGVIGASGSGKSSILRAGLIPALKRNKPLVNGMLSGKDSLDWIVYIITPGAHPLDSLATMLNPNPRAIKAREILRTVLAQDSNQLNRGIQSSATHLQNKNERKRACLLVVDQFEELFAICSEEAERKAFIDNLLDTARSLSDDVPGSSWNSEYPVFVVIGLRADFYAHCAPYPALRQALSQDQEYIGPLRTDELRLAIEEPARLGGWTLEPGLVETLLHDLGASDDQQAEPGALPLLSHALLETWERRRGRMLTLSGYLEAGGVRGAITHTAESTYARLSPEEQAIAQGIFLQLTELGESGLETRRRAALSELIPTQEVSPTQNAASQTMLKTLADARLITTSAESVEIAHEALIREWPRLRSWLEEGREGLRLRRQLTVSALAWERLDRDPGALYRGAQLLQAIEWSQDHPGALNQLELAFLDESRLHTDKEIIEREAQRQRELNAAQKLAEVEHQRVQEQAWSVHRLRRRALYLAGVLILTGILAAIALFWGGRARSQSLIARSHALAAQAITNLDADPELSLLLALQAGQTAETSQAVDALHRAIQASRAVLTFSGHQGEIWAIEYSPDGSTLATASQDGTALLWEAASGKILHRLSDHTDEVLNLAFSPEGARLATTGLDDTLKIWDVNSGRKLQDFPIPASSIGAIAFTPDGAFLLTSRNDGELAFWDAQTGKQMFNLAAHSAEVTAIAFDVEGRRLATASMDGEVKLWDFAELASLVRQTSVGPTILPPLSILTGHTNVVSSLAFSPDGIRLASASFDSTARLWELATGKTSLVLSGHTNGLRGLDFSPDGARLVTAGQDGSAILWDAASGQELIRLNGHKGAVNCVTVSPDGKSAATAGRDGLSKIWDLSLSNRGEALIAPGFAGEFGPDGTHLFVIGLGDGFDIQAQLWSLEPNQPSYVKQGAFLSHSAPVIAGDFSLDHNMLATVSADMLAHIWDATTGKEITSIPLTTHTDEISAIDISPDATSLATASYDGSARIWGISGGEEQLSLIGETDEVWSVAFSPDGRTIATGNGVGTAILWDATSGEELSTLAEHRLPVSAIAFNPRGDLLATGGMDGTSRIWDIRSDKDPLNLSGHTGTILSLTFSPDGKHLATGSADGTARLWDVNSGQQLLSLTTPNRGINLVAFSPDGSRLVTGSFQDMTVRVNLLDFEDLVALAQTHLTRWFTPVECQTYLNTATCPPPPQGSLFLMDIP